MVMSIVSVALIIFGVLYFFQIMITFGIMLINPESFEDRKDFWKNLLIPFYYLFKQYNKLEK